MLTSEHGEVDYSICGISQYKVKLEIKEEPTNRFCVVCGSRIIRRYERDILRKDGTVIGPWVCTWDQRLTCCEMCKTVRQQEIDYEEFGTAKTIWSSSVAYKMRVREAKKNGSRKVVGNTESR